MNEVIKTIMERRSCRCFDPKKMPSEDVLRQIAEAGTWAPTGMGYQNPIILQGWRHLFAGKNNERQGSTQEQS